MRPVGGEWSDRSGLTGVRVSSWEMMALPERSWPVVGCVRVSDGFKENATWARERELWVPVTILLTGVVIVTVVGTGEMALVAELCREGLICCRVLEDGVEMDERLVL